MSTVLAERQTSLLETSADGERKWKNPNEVVRIRRKLSRKASLKLTGKQGRENVHPLRKPCSSEKSRTPVLKRTSENILASPTPPKRLRSGLQDISNSPLSTPDKGIKVQDKQQVQVTTPTNTELATHQQPVLQTPDELDGVFDNNIPIDWALKTKVRFVSPFPFSWTQSLKPHQEVAGITRFMEKCSEKGGDRQTILQQSLMLWSHPSLPFLKTFPRVDNRQKTTPTLLQDEEILQALKDDWSTSLCSVYQLLKCGHCPYFYLCANQFTALFMSAGVCGCPFLSAMISPTTSGMRDALKKEGAELSLPLAPTKLPGCDEEEYSDAEDDSAATSWLTTMGLPAHDFPALRPQRVALQRSREVNIDNHPESVVRVEGGSVHVLFNFLLTSKTTITPTGSHAGVPPTILAPVGFKGATLKSLKVKQGSIQELSEGQMVRRFFLELSGPILPRNLHTLFGLFQKTQHGQFTAHMNNTDATGAFNGGTEHKVADAATSQSTESYLLQRPLGQKHGLREMVCEGHHFTWT